MHKAGTIATLLLFSVLGWAQEPAAPAPDTQAPQAGQGHWGQHRGPGVAGTITAINGDSITLKTRDGQTAQVNVSDKTQFRKDRQTAQISDFKVGDEVFVRGQQASGVWQAEMMGVRPQGSGDMRERMREGMGKQFIAGEITAINGTQVTIARPDGVSQTINADENTSFRKDNQSVTLGDLKVGDHVFGRGELKNDVFVPSVLNVGQPGMMRRGGGSGVQQPPQ